MDIEARHYSVEFCSTSTAVLLRLYHVSTPRSIRPQPNRHEEYLPSFSNGVTLVGRRVAPVKRPAPASTVGNLATTSYATLILLPISNIDRIFSFLRRVLSIDTTLSDSPSRQLVWPCPSHTHRVPAKGPNLHLEIITGTSLLHMHRMTLPIDLI